MIPESNSARERNVICRNVITVFLSSLQTNKGDALANRVQNTLGNYDEMKELITNHSNQSHLVGIPKNSVPQTPVEKEDEPSFFPEGQKGRAAPSHHSLGQSGSSMPPPPSSSLSGSTLLHQGAKKSRSTDWSRGGHSSSNVQPSQGAGPPCGRGKHGASAHELPHGRYEDPFGSQGDASPVATSSLSRRHAPAPKAPSSSSSEHGHKEGARCKSPAEQDPGSHGASSPVPSTSLLPSGLSTPTFPPGLHCKPSAVQQKPTAYVRPMDGQDQAPNDSPELKPRPEIGDGYGAAAFGGLMEVKGGAGNTKSKLPKLTLPQPGEVRVTVRSAVKEPLAFNQGKPWTCLCVLVLYVTVWIGAD